MLLALAAAASTRPTVAASPASSLDDPFPVRNQLPLALPFLEPAPRSGFLVGARVVAWSFSLAYESTLVASDPMIDLYRRDDFATYGGRVTQPVLEGVAAGSPSGSAYYVDGETLRAVLDAQMGLSERFEIGLEVPLLLHTRGFMDSPIDTFHSWLDLPDGGRTVFARNQYVVGYSDDGRTVFLDESPTGLRLGDVVLSGRAALARGAGGRSALAASLLVKLPTGSVERVDGSGHADVAAGLQASWRIGRSALHAGGAYSHLGDWSLDPGLELGERLSLHLAWAYNTSGASAILVQVLGGTGPFPSREDGSLGEPAAELVVGMRHAGPPGWAFEWAVLENLTRDLNVPDVGVFLGVARRSTMRRTPVPGS